MAHIPRTDITVTIEEWLSKSFVGQLVIWFGGHIKEPHFITSLTLWVVKTAARLLEPLLLFCAAYLVISTGISSLLRPDWHDFSLSVLTGAPDVILPGGFVTVWQKFAKKEYGPASVLSLLLIALAVLTGIANAEIFHVIQMSSADINQLLFWRAMLGMAYSTTIIITLLTKRHAEKEMTLAELQQQLDNAQQEMANMQEQLDGRQHELSALHQQVSALQTQRGNAQQEASRLQTSLIDEQQRSSNLQEQLDAERSMATTLRQEISKTNLHMADLTSKIESANLQITSLQNEVELSSVDLQNAYGETTKLAAKLQERDLQVADLSDSLQAANVRIADLQKAQVQTEQPAKSRPAKPGSLPANIENITSIETAKSNRLSHADVLAYMATNPHLKRAEVAANLSISERKVYDAVAWGRTQEEQVADA